MIFQTLKIVAVVVTMTLCTGPVTAQDCGCNGGGAVSSNGGYYSEYNNCGRAPGYAYASSLWSDYCTNDCTRDKSCKGSCNLFKNRGGGGSLFGGHSRGGCLSGGGCSSGGGCMGGGGENFQMVSYAPEQTETVVAEANNAGCNESCGGGMVDGGFIDGGATFFDSGYSDAGCGGGGCSLFGKRRGGGGGLFSKLRGGGGGMFGSGFGGGGSCFGWPGQDCCGGGCGGMSFGGGCGGMSIGGGGFLGGRGGGGLFARHRARHSGGGLFSRHRARHSGGGLFSRIGGGMFTSPMSNVSTFGATGGYFDQMVGADYGNVGMQSGMQGYITSGCGCAPTNTFMPTSVQDANQIQTGCPNTGGCQATPTTFGTMSNDLNMIGTPANGTEFQPATGVIYDGSSNSGLQTPVVSDSVESGSNEVIGESVTTGSAGDLIQDAVDSASEGN